jgi:ABC-2 type transport system ATP-binding protein
MLEMHNLQKVVDGKTVIAVDSFKVTPGQIVGLLASPGSGAETLIALLTGRLRPSAGRLRLGGLQPHTDHTALSQVLGVMFAEDAVYKNLGTLANLRFQARLHGISSAHAEAVLARVGLADQARKPAGKLSPSLQRRLAFGRAILHEPGFLLLIEPFNRCDKTTVRLLTDQVHSLAESGTAILALSAEISRLTSICDLVYELQDGGFVVRPSQSPSEDPLRQPFKIPVKTEDTVLLVNPAEVLYVETGERRTFLVTVESRLPTQYTLTELEQRLVRSGFFRAHRSYLVNLQHVREVIPFTRNSFSLRLDDPAGTQIPLSKSAAGELKELLGY